MNKKVKQKWRRRRRRKTIHFISTSLHLSSLCKAAPGKIGGVFCFASKPVDVLARAIDPQGFASNQQVLREDLRRGSRRHGRLSQESRPFRRSSFFNQKNRKNNSKQQDGVRGRRLASCSCRWSKLMDAERGEIGRVAEDDFFPLSVLIFYPWRPRIALYFLFIENHINLGKLLSFLSFTL